jgi:hypothetical protein
VISLNIDSGDVCDIGAGVATIFGSLSLYDSYSGGTFGTMKELFVLGDRIYAKLHLTAEIDFEDINVAVVNVGTILGNVS